MRLIVGISGASGVIYGIRLLQVLQTLPDIETHLVISDGGKLNISLETGMSVKQAAPFTHSVPLRPGTLPKTTSWCGNVAGCRHCAQSARVVSA